MVIFQQLKEVKLLSSDGKYFTSTKALTKPDNFKMLIMLNDSIWIVYTFSTIFQRA